MLKKSQSLDNYPSVDGSSPSLRTTQFSSPTAESNDLSFGNVETDVLAITDPQLESFAVDGDSRACAPDVEDRDTNGSGGGVDAEAAETFIENKRIGDRIKFLRQRKQMGLVELGRHTGLSASFLSQLETGRVVPTLRNLARIALVFSKDMSYFFEPERPEFFRVLRAQDRQRLPQTGVEDPGYFFESLGHVPLDGGVSPYIAEFLPATDRRQPRSHAHAGSEFLYVLSGCLRLTHDGQPEMLEHGDAVFFHANTNHSYERTGDGDCEVLIITLQEHPKGHHTGSRVPTRGTKNGTANGSKRRR